jgi:hypothetical protein
MICSKCASRVNGMGMPAVWGWGVRNDQMCLEDIRSGPWARVGEFRSLVSKSPAKVSLARTVSGVGCGQPVEHRCGQHDGPSPEAAAAVCLGRDSEYSDRYGRAPHWRGSGGWPAAPRLRQPARWRRPPSAPPAAAGTTRAAAWRWSSSFLCVVRQLQLQQWRRESRPGFVASR